MPESINTKYDLTIIGAGMAGFSAALFAAEHDLSVAQVGSTGEIIFASGLIDLLGVHPLEKRKLRRDPWTAISALSRDNPEHPYARIPRETILKALESVFAFLNTSGLSYYRRIRRNCDVPTAIGTLKRTYGIPQTMKNGVIAFEKKKPCLFIDFNGLKSFSARQITATLKSVWPGVRSKRIVFPEWDHHNELYTEYMARTLEAPGNLERLACLIKPQVKDSQALGLPAILGIYASGRLQAEMEKYLGIPVFEIPSMPPSVTGIRLKETFERSLPPKGIDCFLQKRVLSVAKDAHSGFHLDIGREEKEVSIKTEAVILASGRFIGGGLAADRGTIKETIFDLPIYQPFSRNDWHRLDFLDPRGHPVNRAGLNIDDTFRPLDDSGLPVHETLFAAGSILAHQDWVRMKCGSGLAIASAYAAVQSFIQHAYGK